MPANVATSAEFDALQTRVSQAESNVETLNGRVASLESRVTALETAVAQLGQGADITGFSLTIGGQVVNFVKQA